MISALPFMALKSVTVFVRADLNVPIEKGKIKDDFRLKALQPTLDLLIAEGAKIIIGTHIGRPKDYDKALSTKHLIPWFKDHSYEIEHSTLEEAQSKVKNLKEGTIPLLENLRFFPQEKQNDVAFAQALANLAEVYVNDAFGLLHRHDTSITLLPTLFAEDKRTIGLLIERELSILKRLKENPPRPFTIFLAGGKVKDKLPIIESLLPYVDVIAICPALSFTFDKAQGFEIGKSLVEDSLLEKAHYILNKAKDLVVKIELPVDYMISLNNLNGPLQIVEAQSIPSNGIGLTVGPKTMANYSKIIWNAGSIFLNGTMGLEEQPESLKNMKVLLQTIAQSTAFSVIGGGESVAAVYYYDLEEDINFCSSGGGASLAYISHKTLPGLEVLKNQP